MTEPAFRRSTRCGSGGACVEVAPGNPVLVRNSTDPATVLAVDLPAWRAFLAAVKGDQLDHR